MLCHCQDKMILEKQITEEEKVNTNFGSDKFEDIKGAFRSRKSKKPNTMVKRQTIQWSKDRQYNGQKTDNTMVKRQTTQWSKDRQYNGQQTENAMVKRQTIQWSKERQTIQWSKGQTIQWSKEKMTKQ